MKKSKKSRVSWPPDAILCQITVFQSEDCPAKVCSQPQILENRKLPSGKLSGRMRVPDLPPGFEGNHYAAKHNPLDIPRIKWKRPPKFIISDSWLVRGGEESTERQTENLRIAKVLEAVYPHRAAIPSRPSVSSDTEAEWYDDSKTPLIRLTPIEDELEFTDESFRSIPEPIIPTNPQGQLEPKTPGSTGKPAPSVVSAPGADISLAAYAVLTTLMKTKEPGSDIDPHLLVKFLQDPKMVQDLINNRISKPSESELNTVPVVDTGATSRAVSQHFSTSAPLPSLSHSSSVTPTAMDGNSLPLPNVIPPKPSFATSQPLTPPVSESRVAKYGSESVQVSSPRYISGNFHMISSVSGQSGLTMELPQSKPAHMGQPVSSTLPMNSNPLELRPVSFSTLPVSTGPKPSHRPLFSFPTLAMNLNLVEVPAEQQPLSKSRPPFSTLNMNEVPVLKHQPTFDPHLMDNANRLEVPARLNPSPPIPTKNLDYFKNLIREHGVDRAETHDIDQRLSPPGNYHAKTESCNAGKNVKLGEVNDRIQKPCMYFSSSKGCKLGDKCTYLHDRPYRWRPDVAFGAPTTKRMKFGADR